MSEPTNGTRENPSVVEVQGSVPANVVIRLFVIGFSLMVLIAIAVPLGLRWNDQDARIRETQRLATQNRLLAGKLVETQKDLAQTQRQLKGFVADQCVHAEARDTVNVTQNLSFIRLLNSLAPPGADIPPRTRASLDAFIQSLRDANATLEPEGEKDCQPGPGDQQP